MELQNISFAAYLRQAEEEGYRYTYAIKYGYYLRKPLNYWKLKPLTEFTFEQVKNAQVLFEQGVNICDMPKVINIFIDCPLSELYRFGVVEVCQSFAHIEQEIASIVEVESLRLVRKLTDKEQKTGIDRFDIYGVYPQFRALATAFNTSINEVKKWRYDECFVELCYQKDLAEFQEDYFKQKS